MADNPCQRAVHGTARNEMKQNEQRTTFANSLYLNRIIGWDRRGFVLAFEEPEHAE